MTGFWSGQWDAFYDVASPIYGQIMEWAGQCEAGACPTIADTVFEQAKFLASNVANVIGTGAGQLFINVFGFLPDGGALPERVHIAAVYFGNALRSVNFMLPVVELINLMVITLMVVMTAFSYYVVKKIVNFVRGIQTGAPPGGAWVR